MSKNVKIFLDKILLFFYNVLTMANEVLGLMTIEDLADYLKVTRRTIYEWLKTNKIPAIKLVGQWRFKRDKIDAWLENRSLH